MMKLISIPDLNQLVKKMGLPAFFQGAIEAVRQEFNRWQAFQKTPRHVIHYPHGVIELMPTADEEWYSMKYVNGHPTNHQQNKLTVVALGLLAQAQSGYPVLISEMSILTAVRTAATSALASEYLAKKNSKTLAIIGTGAQAEFQILAHQSLFDLTSVRYYDIDPKAMDKMADNLKNHSFKLIPCHSSQECIEGADIITTATAQKKRAQILKSEWLKPGMHINGIGGDCGGKTELDPLILEKAKIVVEYLPQTQIEGEIQHLSADKVYAELWELVQQKKIGRENDTEVTLFDSVGFAVEDFAILKFIYQQAEHYQLGQVVDLIPTISDPKNLFQLIQDPR